MCVCLYKAVEEIERRVVVKRKEKGPDGRENKMEISKGYIVIRRLLTATMRSPDFFSFFRI